MFEYEQASIGPLSGLDMYRQRQPAVRTQQAPPINPLPIIEMIRGGGSAAAAGEGGSGAAAGGMGAAGMAGIIAGIVAAQHEMSKATDREFEGHKSADVFKGDFFTEPWESYALEKIGIDEATPGERTDAYLAQGKYGKALASMPRTAMRWADPLSDFGYQVGQKKLGKLGGLLDPVRWGLDKLA